MKCGKHTKFILTPVSEILKDCVNATKGLSMGVETYPLCDYIMQTTFLKMTGASEQKLKCILWEIATNDFEFRYDFLSSKTSYGECSNLKDKNKIFKEITAQIKKLSPDTDYIKNIFSDEIKTEIKKKATENIIGVFEKKVLVSWQEKQFIFYKSNFSKVFDNSHFCNYSCDKKQNENISLIENCIDFEHIVYDHRNRCAHNLKSYQENLPDLSNLVKKEYDYENYFFRFSILVLLDEIFMKMYREYLNLLEMNI